jgi:tRNA-dihydrouridine synthase B
MNMLETCATQVRAVTDWFDELATTHRLLPAANAAANDSFIQTQKRA